MTGAEQQQAVADQQYKANALDYEIRKNAKKPAVKKLLKAVEKANKRLFDHIEKNYLAEHLRTPPVKGVKK